MDISQHRPLPSANVEKYVRRGEATNLTKFAWGHPPQVNCEFCMPKKYFFPIAAKEFSKFNGLSKVDIRLFFKRKLKIISDLEKFIN